MGGILEVIRLVQERRSKKVEIQVDNIAVVKDIQSGNKCSWHGLSLLSKVKEFEEYSRLTYNSHICVDGLTKFIISMTSNFCLFEDCPDFISDVN